MVGHRLQVRYFFFFNEIECKMGHTRMMQPLCISKDPCITEEKGGGVGVCEPRC